MLGTTDNNTATQGDQGANPGASPEQSPISFDPNKFAEQLRAEFAHLYGETAVERLVEKHAHKTVGKLEKKVDDFQNVLSEFKTLKAEGLSDTEAEREMRLRRFEAQLAAGNVPATTQQPEGNRSDGLASELALGALQEFGLSDNDPEVAQALIANSKSPVKLVVALQAIQAKRQNQPPPSAASILPSLGGGSSATNTESLYAELEPLYKNATQNGPKIAGILAKLRAAGEPV